MTNGNGNKKITPEEAAEHVKIFARHHSDFEELRPLMLALARNPLNANMSLKRLYIEARNIYDHFKRQRES